jgi:hypothetical protein
LALFCSSMLRARSISLRSCAPASLDTRWVHPSSHVSCPGEVFRVMRHNRMLTTLHQGEQACRGGHVAGLRPPGHVDPQPPVRVQVRQVHPGPGIVPDSQVLQRHGRPGNLAVGRGAVTAATGHDHAAGRDAIPADSPRPRASRYVRYIRLVRFSFLILIGRFVTLEGMKIKSVTPRHH